MFSQRSHELQVNRALQTDEKVSCNTINAHCNALSDKQCLMCFALEKDDKKLPYKDYDLFMAVLSTRIRMHFAGVSGCF